MNPRPTLAAALALLTLSSVATAQQPTAATATQPAATHPAPTIELYGWYSQMGKSVSINIDFCVPVVADSEVNTPVGHDYVTTNFPDSVSAIWESTSGIRLNIKEDLPLLQTLRVEVPHGIRGTGGEVLAGRVATFPTYKGELITHSGEEEGILFVRPASPELAEETRRRISELCYEYEGKRHPMSYRPATVADALAHREAYDMVCHYNLDSEDFQKLKLRPADEQLPDTWVVETPGIPAAGKQVTLILPNSDWNHNLNEPSDEVLVRSTAPPVEYTLSNTCKARGAYEVKLVLGMPASAADAPALLQSLSWSMREDAHSDRWVPLEWKDGALRGKIRGKEVSLTPTETEHRTLRLLEGGEKRGICSLTLAAETGGREVRLRAQGEYPAIAEGSKIQRYFNGKELPTAEDTTMLRPGQPYIYTDITANCMQLRGSTTLRCRYGQLESGTARIRKLAPATPAEAVRLLHDYNERYLGTEEDPYPEDEDAAEKTTAAREKQTAAQPGTPWEERRVNTAPLPATVATAELPLQPGAENELNLPLAELFPGQSPGGFYHVEVSGTPIRNSKLPVVNQGLIQVTDLGLLWKTNGRHIFAYAYRLSTAEDIPTATLRLFDKEGQQLAELTVKNGLAEGDFPAGTRYLQLLTENDSVLLAQDWDDFEYSEYASWTENKLLKQGICPGELPRPLVYLFSDRGLYRPGETAHIKGLARNIQDNILSTPELESVSATISRNYRDICTLPATVEADGSFCVDIPMQDVGDYRIRFELTYKGDANNTSPDKALLAAHPELEHYLSDSRTFYLSLPCKEFRRNEFEVHSKLEVQHAKRRVELSAAATNFSTTPVAQGKVRWNLTLEDANFYPKQPQWRDFRFGDFRENPWEFFYVQYCGEAARGKRQYFSQDGTLDDAGHGRASFSLPAADFPRMRRIIATASVTNGNEQTLSSVQKDTLHPAAVYAGIRTQSALAKVGGTLPVELVAVQPDGTGWNAAPLPATVKVTRTVFRPTRYGSLQNTTVRNSEDSDTQHTMQVQLSGAPTRVEIPVDKAGRYDVEVSGTDAQGQPFRSATRHYVWGDEVSPWEHLDRHELSLRPDKAQYKPGETAQVLVETPVDAELLVTVERGRVLRHYRRSVTVDKPVVEVPIEAGDAPVVYLSVGLVQNDTRRGSDGKPMIRSGSCMLQVEAADKALAVQLQAPEQALLPGEPCTVSGTIRDAAGKPVPDAIVTLYAEDEGTLQVMGYKLPDPSTYFYSEEGRSLGISTFSALGHLVSENLRRREYGNKGVFVGGGDDWEAEADLSDSEQEYLRQNFTPCALWLSTVRTDAQGRFSATYSNPDTLTRYRLMAVAAAGDKFGSGQAAYNVNKPVMLEPNVPMSAVEGDELLLPVTVSMLPDQLPPGSGETTTWQVSLSGQNADIPQPSQTVTLSGNTPATLHFPVRILSAAPTELQWRVQAVNAAPSSPLARVKDAVQLSFAAAPPTPHQREYVWSELANGQTTTLPALLRNNYRPGGNVQLTFSTSPLAGLGYPLQYLITYPYGCTEQLCSTVLPWVLKDDLQKTLGLLYPTDKLQDSILHEVLQKLTNRRLGAGRFGYWNGDKSPSEFSPYAVLVLRLMQKATFRDFQALKTNIRNNTDNPWLSLAVLAFCDKANAADAEAMLAHGEARTPQQKWILAYCAAKLKHPQAQQLQREAQAAESTHNTEYALPPLEALRALYAVETAPAVPATTALLRDYLRGSAGQYSTWRNAWMLLAVHAYTKENGLSNRRAKVNDTAISHAAPMQIRTATGAADSWHSIGNTVYLSGYAEGYLVQQQPAQAVDSGFRVQRRYEQLQTDGSWKPTGTFRVGDIVRVTVSAGATDNTQPLHYLVLEDRLPAAFEAVDPALTSQALPRGINAETLRSWFYFPAAVSNREFLKDRVRVFANHLWGRNLEVSYIARVVRSGKVTAPAAKAELMYSPEIHGLSIPQSFEVKPR